MEKLTAQNGKIRIIYGGYRYRKDADLAGGGSSFRCLRSACRGRMKIDKDDKALSSTVHNHEPGPEVEKVRQIASSDSHAGVWMLVEPLSKKMTFCIPRILKLALKTLQYRRNRKIFLVTARVFLLPRKCGSIPLRRMCLYA